MATDDKSDGKPASAPVAEPTKPKRGRPPKPKTDDAPAADSASGKDIRHEKLEEAPKKDAPGTPPSPVARVAPQAEQPRRTTTIKRSRPRTIDPKPSPKEDDSSTTRIVIIVLAGLAALGALYFARKGNSTPTEPTTSQGDSISDSITLAWKAAEREVVDLSDKLEMRLGKK